MKNFSQFSFFLTIIALGFSVSCNPTVSGNSDNADSTFTVLSYNIENLFDTIDAPDKFDEEFMPNTKKDWNTERYNKKLKDIAKVMAAINQAELPELVGLVEVENRAVLEDLVKQEVLLAANYAIVHEESPDFRGIDVALLYKPSEFEYLLHEKLAVNFDFEPETKTRDILYVKGIAPGSDTLHVFVNHWSSRRGGVAQSEPKRVFAAEVARKKVDEILDVSPNAKIILIGDFNDEPSNKSLKETLMATKNNPGKTYELYNLLYQKHENGEGTYNFRGNWNMLDNLIVSQALMTKNQGYSVSDEGGQIFKEDWIMFTHRESGDQSPNRTYGGPNYYGGYSDHLPVYFTLKR